MLHVETGRREAADRLIECLLNATLRTSSDATQVDLHVVDHGRNTTNLSPYDYRLTNSVVRVGRSPSRLPVQLLLQEPTAISSWLAPAGVRVFRDCQASGMAYRIGCCNVSDALICPVFGTRPDPLGVVVMLWTEADRLQPDTDLTDLMEAMERAVIQIAAVLELCEMTSAVMERGAGVGQRACLV